MPIDLERLRKLRPKRRTSGMQKSNLETAYRSHDKYIKMHPQYDLIKEALREGISCADIAKWFNDQRWIDVSVKTFEQYLYTFKRFNSAIVNKGEDDSIDGVINGNRPHFETRNELQKLFRLQKLRLKIGYNIEKNAGILVNHNAREMEVARRILHSLSEIDGTVIPGGGRVPMGAADQETKEALRKITADQVQRDRLTLMAETLVSGIPSKETKDE